MLSIKLLLGIICFTLTGSIRMLDGNLLAHTNKHVNDHRSNLIRIAQNEIGVREKTGNNDGVRVEAYLSSVRLKKGQPWCAAFLSWVYAQEGLLKPRSGWSPDLLPYSRLTRSALPGNILGIYFPALKRIAHVGLIIKLDGDLVTSIEGNTNVNGSREGDGVYTKIRHIKTIYRIADWVAERGKLE